jgi:Holliday junction resolvasome RuvABC ATP-dependent DNA helicase subunit
MNKHLLAYVYEFEQINQEKQEIDEQVAQTIIEVCAVLQYIKEKFEDDLDEDNLEKVHSLVKQIQEQVTQPPIKRSTAKKKYSEKLLEQLWLVEKKKDKDICNALNINRNSLQRYKRKLLQKIKEREEKALKRSTKRLNIVVDPNQTTIDDHINP